MRDQTKKDPSKKLPTATDKHVGTRIRIRRLMLGITQTTLAEAVGVTFQQIQKYEKGTNRIGASRLQEIANFLQAPMSFFFDGAPHLSASPPLETDAIPYVADHSGFLASSDGMALAKALTQIKHPKLRHRIVKLLEEIASEQKQDEDA